MWTTGVAFRRKLRNRVTNQEGKLTYQILFLQRIWSTIKSKLKIKPQTENKINTKEIYNLMLYYKFLLIIVFEIIFENRMIATWHYDIIVSNTLLTAIFLYLFCMFFLWFGIENDPERIEMSAVLFWTLIWWYFISFVGIIFDILICLLDSLLCTLICVEKQRWWFTLAFLNKFLLIL